MAPGLPRPPPAIDQGWERRWSQEISPHTPGMAYSNVSHLPPQLLQRCRGIAPPDPPARDLRSPRHRDLHLFLHKVTAQHTHCPEREDAGILSPKNTEQQVSVRQSGSTDLAGRREKEHPAHQSAPGFSVSLRRWSIKPLNNKISIAQRLLQCSWCRETHLDAG